MGHLSFFPDHGEHGEPHVGEGLRREAAVADAQHVRHGLEQRPRVLLQPVGLLKDGGGSKLKSEVCGTIPACVSHPQDKGKANFLSQSKRPRSEGS